MLNWPALAVAAAGAPLLLLAPLCLGRNHAIVAAPVPEGEGVANDPRRHFVHASMLLALLASFAVGTFEVGFNLFGTQTLGLTTATMAAMFITCSLAMLAAQSMLLLSSVRRRVDQRWVAAAFAGSALALAFTSLVPDAGSLGRQAAAGNLGQAIGSMSAGSLFTFAPMAPFWTAAVILLLGAVLSMVWWGPTRLREIAAGTLAGARDSATAAVSSDLPAPQG